MKQERAIFLYDGERVFCNSTVIFFLDHTAAVGLVIPKLIRDYCYSVISRSRKHIPGFGKNAGRLLAADERARFLCQ